MRRPSEVTTNGSGSGIVPTVSVVFASRYLRIPRSQRRGDLSQRCCCCCCCCCCYCCYHPFGIPCFSNTGFRMQMTARTPLLCFLTRTPSWLDPERSTERERCERSGGERRQKARQRAREKERGAPTASLLPVLPLLLLLLLLLLLPLSLWSLLFLRLVLSRSSRTMSGFLASPCLGIACTAFSFLEKSFLIVQMGHSAQLE